VTPVLVVVLDRPTAIRQSAAALFVLRIRILPLPRRSGHAVRDTSGMSARSRMRWMLFASNLGGPRSDTPAPAIKPDSSYMRAALSFNPGRSKLEIGDLTVENS
jgi:hypothetical protein